MKKNKKKCNQNNSMVKKDNFYSLLLRWFTWQKVGVILTGLGIVVTIIIFLLSQEKGKSEVEIVKERISENITTIQSTFHPEKIPEALDSLPDVKMVRNFKELSVDAGTLWEAVENIEPYTYHIKNGQHQVEFVWEKNLERERKLDSLYLYIDRTVRQLQVYSVDHELDGYKMINYSKFFKLREQLSDKSNMYKQASDEFIKYKNKNEQEKAYQTYDIMKNKAEYYAFDDTFFEFLIDANKVYDACLAKYHGSVIE